MTIRFRPKRRMLDEAMNEERAFGSMEALLDYLVEDNHNLFSKEDIFFSYYGYDGRIDWETYVVCVRRFGDEDYVEKYHCPQCIGYMTFKY